MTIDKGVWPNNKYVICVVNRCMFAILNYMYGNPDICCKILMKRGLKVAEGLTALYDYLIKNIGKINK